MPSNSWIRITPRDYTVISLYYREKTELIPAVSVQNGKIYINDSFSEQARKDLKRVGVFAYGRFFYNPYIKAQV